MPSMSRTILRRYAGPITYECLSRDRAASPIVWLGPSHATAPLRAARVNQSALFKPRCNRWSNKPSRAAACGFTSRCNRSLAHQFPHAESLARERCSTSSEIRAFRVKVVRTKVGGSESGARCNVHHCILDAASVAARSMCINRDADLHVCEYLRTRFSVFARQ